MDKYRLPEKNKIILLFFLFLFVFVSLQPLFSLSAGATTSPPPTDALPQNLVQPIFPLQTTPIEIREQTIILDWAEENTTITAIYHLINPGDKKTTPKIGIHLPATNPSLQVFHHGEAIEINYNPKIAGYAWEIKLEPHEEVVLRINYHIHNETNAQGLAQWGYQFSPPENNFHNHTLTHFTLMLNFLDTHPGQITTLQPHNYFFQGNTLVWQGSIPELLETNAIMITANLGAEQQNWLNFLSSPEKELIADWAIEKEYPEILALLEKRHAEITSTEGKQALALGQAYYLQKIGEPKKALNIFADLVNHEAPFPRAYWAMGIFYEQHQNKLLNLFNQIQDLKVHPLLQPWLRGQLPKEKTKPVPPVITINHADTNASREGILFKSHVEDKDADLTSIILRYHWEGCASEEINFPVQPFQYDYELLHLTLAPTPFKRLYYEYVITDAAGHETSTGKKETFYLNKEIQSSTFILDGADLILGDYTPKEQTKVHKWFTSYLKMAKEAGFIPIKAKSPLFIFMGKKHDFLNDYQGTLFVCFTPAPFTPQETKIAVHRYFLSYWYGPGWHTLPLHELAPLGDALLLNKGWYAQIFTYLQNKDHHLFAQLLSAIGSGQGWPEALAATYQLTILKLNFLTVWHITGNYVLALLLILSFTWLSKNGYLTKIRQYFRAAK